MKDAEFISELFVIVVDGIQDQQKTLDTFYADHDVVFPRKSRSMARFRQIVATLQSIKDTIRNTRLGNKSDFYGLFAAVNELKLSAHNPLDLSPVTKDL
jgi:hypothetical protein